MGTRRIGSLAGAAAVVLVVVAAIVHGFTEYVPDGETVAAHFEDNANTTYLAGFMGMIAAFLMLWFAGTVNAVMSSRSEGRLTTIATAGTIVGAAGLGLAFLVLIPAGARADDGAVDPVLAATLSDLSGAMFMLAAIGLAALVLAFSIAAKRSGLGPAWLAWLGVVVAILTISPIGYIVMAAAFAWVVGISVWAYLRAG